MGVSCNDVSIGGRLRLFLVLSVAILHKNDTMRELRAWPSTVDPDLCIYLGTALCHALFLNMPGIHDFRYP